MRKFENCNIYEIQDGRYFMDGKPHPRFSNAQRMEENTDKQLVENVFKTFDFIKANCPMAEGTFSCHHDVYHKTHLIVSDGEICLCTGSHGGGYANYLTKEGSAVYSQGSCQDYPYFFDGHYLFPNSRLEEYLSQWQYIKQQVMASHTSRNNIYSEGFEA